MGGFYANIVVRTANVDAIVDVVRQTTFASTIASNAGHVVLADTKLDEQNEEWMAELAVRLAHATGCPALGVMDHDDSVLLMCLADGIGTPLLYNSCPDYFTGEGGSEPMAVMSRNLRFFSIRVSAGSRSIRY